MTSNTWIPDSPPRVERRGRAGCRGAVGGMLGGLAGLFLLVGLSGCGGGAAGANEINSSPGGSGSTTEPSGGTKDPGSSGGSGGGSHHGADTLHFMKTDPDQAALGNLLFYDKILSGNRNIACATCHHALANNGDGLSLPIGEGGIGLSVARDTGTGADAVFGRVPRNAPPLFNLGVTELTALFWDGRVQLDAAAPSGFDTPAGDDLPLGLGSLLAAQAMFPVTSDVEMAGGPGENPIADAAAVGDLAGPDGVWAQLAQRIRDIPEYVELFENAFDDVASADDITMVHVARAIAAFEARDFRFTNSPFDEFLAGKSSALTTQQKRGMALFNGRAGCSICHSGPLQTDFDFHPTAQPQIGPGKGIGVLGQEDFGRAVVSGDPDERYYFRTPSLRNVALTAPYGHAGAFDTLEAQVRHYIDTTVSINNYDRSQAVLPSRPDLDALDFLIMDRQDVLDEIADEAAAEFLELGAQPRDLSDRDITDLLAFLQSLTDPAALDLRFLVPDRVPSGLPLAD
jgi:cytochrome c peroxidase